MRILTLNLNGIRSATTKGVVAWLASTDADVICLQEVRAFPEQVPTEWQSLGFHAEWYPAEKPGYSGVAVLSKTKPKKVTRGMNSTFDSEGRVLQADFGKLSVVSTYIPSGTSSPERLAIKLKFMDEFLLHCQHLRKSKRQFVFCGDFNVAHQQIDLKNWRSNQKNSGFLPEEREWLTRFLEAGYHDTFRHLVGPEAEHYSWWSNRGNARANNVGWRLDYHFTTPGMNKAAHSPVIHTDQFFSDHAPVVIDYDV
ncbi:MAG: exodeoxyribonuclease III [Blastocatellia bacterium]